MNDKFSIENFVEDSVPSIEENDRNFRSISDEIDKRIATAGTRRKRRIIGRAKNKIESTKNETVIVLEEGKRAAEIIFLKTILILKTAAQRRCALAGITYGAEACLTVYVHRAV